jgi:hypothetical protein
MLKIHMQATAIVALPTLSPCPTTILCLISLNDQAKARTIGIKKKSGIAPLWLNFRV